MQVLWMHTHILEGRLQHKHVKERYLHHRLSEDKKKFEKLLKTTEERLDTFWGCSNIAKLSNDLTWNKHQEWSHTIWRHTDVAKWSGWLHTSIKNGHSLPEDAQTLKMVRVTSHKHQEWSQTSWGWTDIANWSGWLHKSIKNDHSLPEDAQTLQNDQGNFTQASRMITHFLSMHRQSKMVRVTSHNHQEWPLTSWACSKMVRVASHNHREWSLTCWGWRDIAKGSGWLHTSIEIDTHILKMQRCCKMVRVTSHKHQQWSPTCWGCTDIAKWSGWLHTNLSIKNDHSLAEDEQTLQNGQGDFTQASRMITHILRMHRHCKMVRVTSHKHQEWSLTSWGCTDIAKNGQGDFTQSLRMITHSLRMHRHCKRGWVTSHNHQEWSLTSWGCTDIAKWSGWLHKSIKNDHSLAEDAQTLQNDQGDFTQASRMITHLLRMNRHCKMVRVTSHKPEHQEWSLTHWGCTDIAKWSGWLHTSIKNDHSLPEDEQTL